MTRDGGKKPNAEVKKNSDVQKEALIFLYLQVLKTQSSVRSQT